MSTASPHHHNAYLVLAHEDVDMLNILTQRLVNTGFVYIHLDRLSKIQITQLTPHPQSQSHQTNQSELGRLLHR